MADAQTLKDQHAASIMSDPNVSSVGIGVDDDGNEVLVIGVKVATQEISVPEALSDDDYEIQEVGEIVPEVVGTHVVPQADRMARHRPVPGGVSAGHESVTAGTVSYILTDGSTEYTASNNHVYSAINQGAEGDPILQPGSADGGTGEDQSAILAGYVPIENGTTLDLAWAAQEVEHTTELLGVGVPTGDPRRVQVGDVLIKSGRTTAVTEGDVLQTNVTVDVNYGDAGIITLEDQILTTDMSEPGDSGSAALIKGEGVPGGLLFAGSSEVTVLNQAVNIESETGMAIVTDSDGGGGDGTPTATVEFNLTAESPTEGNVQAAVNGDGSPIEGATVSIQGPVSQQQQTDASGVALFEAVPIGDYSVSANANGYVGATKNVSSGDFG